MGRQTYKSEQYCNLILMYFGQTVTKFQVCNCKKVQVGKDQEKAQSEKDSHSKNRGGKKPS